VPLEANFLDERKWQRASVSIGKKESDKAFLSPLFIHKTVRGKSVFFAQPG
jgi:hypothetical protein